MISNSGEATALAMAESTARKILLESQVNTARLGA
jgi:hypothetical protein